MSSNLFFAGLSPQLADLAFEGVPVTVTVGDQTVALELTDRGARGSLGTLTVVVTVDRDPGGIRWRTELANDGPTAIADVSVLPLDLRLRLGNDPRVPRIRHLSGSWHFDAAYPPRAFRVSEEAFLTHDHTRPVAVGGVNAGRHSPLVQFALGAPIELGLSVGLEWSGSWRIEAGWAELSFHGEARPPFRITGASDIERLTLEAGQHIAAPVVRLFGGAVTSWDELSDLQRAAMRATRPSSAVPTMPVSYDTWFGRYEQFTVETLLADAERAAEVGVEVFCLDACWYRSEHVYDGLGNWFTPDPVRFPGGAADVARLADRVRELGMRFGLWHLIQLAAPDSDAVRARPELFRPARDSGSRERRQNEFGTLQLPGRLGFHGLELALELDEAVDFALEVCERWIRDWGVEWFRFESIPVDGADYNAGYDRLIHELRQRHPGLYIEACNGGGQRLDLHSVRSTHGNWLSDHTSAPEVTRFNQTGALRFWPAHMLSMAVTAFPGSGDRQASLYEVISRMSGVLSFNGALLEWSPTALAQVRDAVQLYKEVRDDLDGDVEFPLPQARDVDDWDAVAFRSRDSDGLLLFTYRVQGPARRRLALRSPVRAASLVLSSDPAATIVVAEGAVEIEQAPRSAAIWRLG